MKEGTENSVKFKKLKRRLSLPEWQVIGLLEAIWKLTRNSAPEGDIGRFDNEDIAASIEYEDDPDELIRHLVECGWLDEDEEYRLIVHDWSEHVPTYLKGNFAKRQKLFADQDAKQRTKHGAKEGAKQPAKEGAKDTAKQGATKPSLAKPSQAKPSQVESSSSFIENQEFRDLLEAWKSVRFEEHNSVLGPSQEQFVLMEIGRLCGDNVDAAIDLMRFNVNISSKSIRVPDPPKAKANANGKSRPTVEELFS